MSEEFIYIVNGEKINGNKRKNLLGKNETIGLRLKKSDRNKGIGLTMPITMPITIVL